jgi:hypothetical protein
MRAWLESERKGSVAPPHPAPSHPPSPRGGFGVAGPAPSHPAPPLALPAPAPSGASYWMLGAGVVAAQIWMALKTWRNKKIGA